MPGVDDVVKRLAGPAVGHRSEATIQADVRMLLLVADLGLDDDHLQVDLETPVRGGRRIDIEVGCTVIEVKKSLDSPRVVAAAAEQLAGYVRERQNELGQRYVGILTDGRTWIAHHEAEGVLVEATRIKAKPTEPQRLTLWLEGVLATRDGVVPAPGEIVARLGHASSGHALDIASLTALYREHRDDPTVVLKRDLWAELLRSALGTQFTNSDELFIEHTYLVNSAEIIAHLVLGVDAAALPPEQVLSGEQFAIAGLHGVVAHDFFDWVVEVEGGAGFVTALARRLARFDWSHVEHDVLKVLYESVIPAQTRKDLGEYYTPDWLGHEVVATAITDPLNERVLDPSCGSGTFLFHAIRRYLEAADEADLPLGEQMNTVTQRVIGMDLHPVAVALARVTYVLALGRERLQSRDRTDLTIPVYLADSLGWSTGGVDLFTQDSLVVDTEVGDQIFSGQLVFPGNLLTDGARFDSIVDALVSESDKAQGTAKTRLSAGAIRRLSLSDEEATALEAVFVRLRELHEAGRNHIWAYYVKNVARPSWLSLRENNVDVLIGNPPWLSYRHMTTTMKRSFKSLSKLDHLWSDDGSNTTHQDLAGLFIVRAATRYLRSGGRLAFVVPSAVIDRDYWTGFRAGNYGEIDIAWTESWDLRRLRPHFFPRAAAVVFGTKTPEPAAMPTATEVWTGRAPRAHALLTPSDEIQRTPGSVVIAGSDRSPWAERFASGANLFPRLIFRVEAVESPLGVPAGRAAVQSKRSAEEKAPWKPLDALTGVIEDSFLRPTVVGGDILPFRLREPAMFVVPYDERSQSLVEDDGIDAYPGLAAWWEAGTEVWQRHGKSTLTLLQQADTMNKLRQQFPIPPYRVVYGASGMHLSAAVLTDRRAVVEHGAYWGAARSLDEADFLVAVMNAPSLTAMTRPFMSYGKDERHIDSAVWNIPIPLYDADNPHHVEIRDLGRILAEEVAAMEFASDYFVTQRKQVRAHLATTDTGRALDRAVVALFTETAPDAVAAADTDDAATA